MKPVASAALLAVVLALASHDVDAQQQSWKWCRGDSGNFPIRPRLQSILEGIAGTDSVAMRMRSVYELPVLPPDSVLVVSDEDVCRRASYAYYRGSMGPPKSVLVARVGNRYAVDGDSWAGEWRIMVIMTLGFQRLAGIAH